MSKSLLSSPILQFLIGRSIGLYMHLAAETTAWRVEGREHAERIWAEGGGVIACVWHGRFMQAHRMWRPPRGVQRPTMLISQSREGGLITHAALTVGAKVVRGSAAKGEKRKGGFEAMREMLRQLAGGACICLTPDGPRGPRMRAKMGPIQLAKLSGAPLIAMAWSSNNRRVLGSWDRLTLPVPFGRGTMVWGAPIYVARNTDDAGMEAARLALEAELNRISRRADELAGVIPIEPDIALTRELAAEPVAP